MALDTQKRKQVVYFVGDEIENTIAKGFRTLFVVGTRDPKEIMDLADHHNCKHIYFGTSQSYDGNEQFTTVMKELLENKYWVTLDFGIEFIETVTDTGLMKFERFIPMVSAKIPNIYKLNKNTTLKIDDVTWGHSNTGVWSKNLKDITDHMHYTDWSEYVGDTVIDVDNNDLSLIHI